MDHLQNRDLDRIRVGRFLGMDPDRVLSEWSPTLDYGSPSFPHNATDAAAAGSSQGNSSVYSLQNIHLHHREQLHGDVSPQVEVPCFFEWVGLVYPVSGRLTLACVVPQQLS